MSCLNDDRNFSNLFSERITEETADACLVTGEGSLLAGEATVGVCVVSSHTLCAFESCRIRENIKSNVLCYVLII
jgi:molybdopterin synthase catalytic subunit